jgi:hypothetical protein
MNELLRNNIFLKLKFVVLSFMLIYLLSICGYVCGRYEKYFPFGIQAYAVADIAFA